MRRERTLLIHEVAELPKAREFLNSKARNSPRTKNTYHFALSHFQTFLKNSNQYKNYDVQTILEPLRHKKINVYSLLDNFVDYLMNRQDQFLGGKKLRPPTTILYVAGVRSYLECYDIDTHRFQRKVTLPRKLRIEPEPIDTEDIATMLKACSNKRLRAFILLLATTGMRANEALSLKNSDIDFSQSPTRIHVRAEITKTKTERYIYTTDEATKYLKIFIDSKYKNYKWKPDHILFKVQNNDEQDKGRLYVRVSSHFTRLLEEIGMDKRKDGDGKQQRKISFHSFRRFVKTTISNQGLQDYSEWFLGHYSSISAKYYTTKEQVRKDLYKDLMKYLTFLDIRTVESVGRDYESKLKERDQEVEQLRDKLFEYEHDEMQNLEYDKLRDKEIAELKHRLEIMEKEGMNLINIINEDRKDYRKEKNEMMIEFLQTQEKLEDKIAQYEKGRQGNQSSKKKLKK